MKKLLVVSLLAAVGCVHESGLQPVPAPGVAVSNDVAQTQVAGVTVQVSGRWNGDPPDLPRVLATLDVGIENRSGHPLRVAYQDMALVGRTGFRYAALPPFSIRATISERGLPQVAPGRYEDQRRAELTFATYDERQPPALTLAQGAIGGPVVHPRFRYNRFHVAPPFGPMYPGFGTWPYRPWTYDPFFYERAYGFWPRTLPTRDMLEQALPEGAIEDGGSVSGFVYFQMPPGNESTVSFEMKLIDANTGEQFGTVSIPLLDKR